MARFLGQLLVSSEAGDGAQLYLLDQKLQVTEAIDVGAAVLDTKASPDYVFAATSHDDHELMILDANFQLIGSYDVPGSEDPCSVVVAFGGVLLGMPRGDTHLVSLADLSQPILTGTIQASCFQVAQSAIWAPWQYRIGAVDDLIGDHLHTPPLTIPDVNGDGIVKFGCAGDSNTFSVPTHVSWCKKLADLVLWEHFARENRSRLGGTVLNDGARSY